MTTRDRIERTKAYLNNLCPKHLTEVLNRAVLVKDLTADDLYECICSCGCELVSASVYTEEDQQADRISGLEDHVFGLLDKLNNQDYEATLLLIIDWLE
jgi:hypothetical protein